MSKAARGTKRVCPGCGAKYYDLNNTPIVCPLCGAEYKLTRQAATHESRAEEVKEAAKPKQARPAAAMAEADTGLDIDPELEGVEDEDLVSLDDVEEPDTGDDEDDAFLPDEDEGEDDVSGFIGESRQKDDDEV